MALPPLGHAPQAFAGASHTPGCTRAYPTQQQALSTGRGRLAYQGGVEVLHRGTLCTLDTPPCPTPPSNAHVWAIAGGGS